MEGYGTYEDRIDRELDYEDVYVRPDYEARVRALQDHVAHERDRERRRQEAERIEALEEWVAQHPEIGDDPDLEQRIIEQVTGLAERTGSDELLTDLRVLDDALLVAKAERDAQPSYADKRRADVRAAANLDEHGFPVKPAEKQSERADRESFREDTQPTMDERITASVIESGGDPNDYGARRRAELRLAGRENATVTTERVEGPLGEVLPTPGEAFGQPEPPGQIELAVDRGEGLEPLESIELSDEAA
jgi:hypothetical protein